MKFFKNPLILAVLLALLSTACNKKARTLSVDTLDSLKLTYQQINNELEFSWTEMMMDDDGKLENMRRILQEISYSGDYSVVTHEGLKKEVEDLAAIRYDRETMSNSDLITNYDDKTNTTMSGLMEFTTGLPQFEQYPLMGQLLQEVFEADDRVLQYRIQYDRAVKSYNQFIEENEPYLEQIANQEILQAKSLFELQE